MAGFNLDNAMENPAIVERREAISTSEFNLHNAMDEEKLKDKKPSISRFFRRFMKDTPFEKIQSLPQDIADYAGIEETDTPEQRQQKYKDMQRRSRERHQEYRRALEAGEIKAGEAHKLRTEEDINRVKKAERLIALREEEVIDEGLFRQLEGPVMGIALPAGMLSAPIHTSVALGLFMAKDKYIINGKELMEEFHPNAHPMLKDTVEAVDLVGSALAIGAVMDPKLRVKVTETFTKAKTTRVLPEEISSILMSDKLSKAEKIDALKKLDITEDMAKMSVSKNKPIDVKTSRLAELYESKYWERLKETVKEKKTVTEPAGKKKTGIPEKDLSAKELEARVNKILTDKKTTAREKLKLLDELKTKAPEKAPVVKTPAEKPIETPTESALVGEFKKASKEATESRTKYMDETQAGKTRKGDALRDASTVRKLEGKPTAIEVKNEMSLLDRYSVGKPVRTPDGPGVIASKPSFGRFQVVTQKGKKSYLTKDLKAPKATKQQAIDSLRVKAEKEAGNFLKVRGVKGKFTNIVDKPKVEKVKKSTKKTTKKEVKKKEPPKKTEESKAFNRAREKYKEELEAQPEATYTEVTIADQMAKSFEIVKKHPDRAKNIALGVEPAPAGLTESAVSIAYAETMMSKGKWAEFAEATRSRSLRQTQRGQEIVMEKAAATNVNDPVAFTKKIIQARMEVIGKKGYKPNFFDKKDTPKTRFTEKVKQESKRARNELNKKQLDIKEAQKLIDELKC
jgi:hypothetical protein